MATERELTVEVLALIAAEVVRPVFFIFADFPSTPKRVWTGQGNIQFQGFLWTGVGEVIAFESIRETTETGAQGLKFTINGAPQALLDMVVEDDYQGRDVEVWFAFYDATETTIYAPARPLWAGKLDSDEIQIGKDGRTISILAEHDLVDILRSRGVRYTSADQKWLYPEVTDTGLDKIPLLQDKSIPWGRTQV